MTRAMKIAARQMINRNKNKLRIDIDEICETTEDKERFKIVHKST